MPEMTVIDGLEMRFEVHGEGIPIVYTPGAFYRLEDAHPVAQALAALGYRVLLWDRPNTGGSGLLFADEHLLLLWADKLHVLLRSTSRLPLWRASQMGCWPRCISLAAIRRTSRRSCSSRH
jgi:pimeloyl-ACP methyl ester carboxylesterase